MNAVSAHGCRRVHRRASVLIGIILACGSSLLRPGFAVADGDARADPPATLTVERVSDPGSVVLKITLKNTSRADLTIGVGGAPMDYELAVTSAQGVAVPFSKRGEELFSKSRIRSTMYVAVTLRPGEARVDTWPISDLFNFTRPGQYPISVKRQLRAGTLNLTVSSNVLRVVLG